MSSLTPVLLPGNMCDLRLWQRGGDAIWQALARPGIADPSPANLAHDDTIAAMATRVLASVMGRILPIGFSMGAIVAVEMWRQAPGRIAGLALLGYNASADLPERAVRRPAQQLAARTGNLDRVLTKDLMPHYFSAAHRDDRDLRALIRTMALDLGTEVFIRQSEALRLRGGAQELLPRIDVPVLYACGAEDVICPPSWHKRWAGMTPGANLAVIPDAGHMLPLEAPEVMAQAVGGWLSAGGVA